MIHMTGEDKASGVGLSKEKKSEACGRRREEMNHHHSSILLLPTETVLLTDSVDGLQIIA